MNRSVSVVGTSLSEARMTADERREWIRIEDTLLLEYRLSGESAETSSREQPSVTPDVIAAAVGKPTADLLARSGDALNESALLPWVMKVDWLIEVILKTLAKAHPDCMEIARMTQVNISGGGIGFVSPRSFSAGDRLEIKIILPPFVPIHTVAHIIRASPDPQGQGCALATEFVDLKADDQEHLIRYIIHTQAERLRACRRQTA
jgi:hypothetical protein